LIGASYPARQAGSKKGDEFEGFRRNKRKKLGLSPREESSGKIEGENADPRKRGLREHGPPVFRDDRTQGREKRSKGEEGGKKY